MGLRIRTNVQSLIAQRSLQASINSGGEHSQKLASGFRINRAADDAAGMAISERLNADVRSLRQAQRNSNDGISLLQVAEGGLGEINNIVIRLKELAVQSASDTLGNKERDYLNREFMALKDEIDRIALSTEFVGTRLLIGAKQVDPSLTTSHNPSPMEIQVGKDYVLPPDSLDAPNPVHIIRMDMSRLNATTDGEGSLSLGSAQNESGTRVDSKVNAQLAMGTIDSALDKIASYRGDIGALQNRLDSTDRNLSVQIENLTTAKSRIKDADFASETAEFAQNNILTQAGASVLTQANQLPSIALKLLQN